MASIIQFTLYLLAILIPIIFTPSTSELFEFPKFLLLLSGTLIIAATWLVHFLQTGKFTFKINAVGYGILAVLTTQILATLFSIHPYTSFWGYYGRFHGGLFSTICYTIIYFAAITWLDTKSTQKLLKISLNTAIFVGLLAILEHYNFSLSCILINLSQKNYVIPEIFTNACWSASTNPSNRSFSLLGQPNWLAAYLIPHFFLLISKFKLNKNKLPSLYSIFLFSILLTALLYTRSRSGFLAFAIAYLTYWVLQIRTFTYTKIKSQFYRYTILLIAILLTFGTPYSPSLSSLFTTRHSPATMSPATSGTVLENGGTESGDIRKIVWLGALKLIQAHPLLGTGPETFAYTYYQVRPIAHNLTSEWDYLYNKAHNEYLNMAAGAGLIGLFAYLYFHYAIFVSSLTLVPKSKKTNQQTDESMRQFYPVIGATIVSFAATSFFGFSVVPVYFLLIIIAAVPATLDQALPSSQSKAPYYLYFAFPVLLLYPLRIYFADTQYTIGKQLLDVGKYPNAIVYLQKAVSNRPGLDLFHASLAEAYAQNDQKDLALQEVARNQSLNPIHLNFFKSRAKVYLILAAKEPSYYLQAATEIEKARSLAPTDPKLAYNLGLIYTRTNQLPLAQKELRDAITLKPNYAEPYYALTLLYEQTKHADQIPDLLKQAKTNLSTYSAQLKDKIDKYVP